MADSQAKKDKTSSPPGRVKIANALKLLLRNKDFSSITTSEISRVAGVNESLIYRYFKDKRGLLHQVLADDLEYFIALMADDIKGIGGTLNKLGKLIRGHIWYYARDRVFARILLLEVRNFPGYFESETYRLVRHYAKILTEIIKEGVENGEIRDDIEPERIRDLVLGGIEHFCLASVIFGHDIPTDPLADDLCELLFQGIKKK
ncbi:MAG: TetR/AcrR family transcriptional regulator [Desulfobacteraceae bacterium]|nr:TetR/AcrR family transcriptional regulator [Desulfobacteraceae bacterium]